MKFSLNILICDTSYNITCDDIELLSVIKLLFQSINYKEKLKNSIDIIIKKAMHNGYIRILNGEEKMLSKDNVLLELIDLISEPFNMNIVNKYAYFHGGSVCDDKGNCIFIIAPTMNGKTTITTMLSLNGYHYMGDDIIICDNDMNICCYPTPIKIRYNKFWDKIDLKEFYNIYIRENNSLIIGSKNTISLDIKLCPFIVLFLNRHENEVGFTFERLNETQTVEKLLVNSACISDCWTHILISKKIAERAKCFNLNYNNYAQVLDFIFNYKNH